MSKWKHSFYNIDLNAEGYKKAKENEYYNVLMGKFAVIPKDVDLDSPPEELKGFLIPAEINQAEIIKGQQINAFEEQATHMSLLITVSSKCNYHCEYCFQGNHAHGINMAEETVADTISYIKREIDSNDKLKSLGVTFFGGEPLMGMNAIRKLSRFLLEYTKEKGLTYRAAIDTNGFFLTADISKELKEFGVVKAQIAFDGFEDFYNATRKAPKDAYKRVLKNIEDSEIPIIIRVNVTKKNQDEAKELIRYLYSLDSVKEGKDKVSIMRVSVYGGESDCNFTDKEWLQFREGFTDFLDVADASTLFKLPSAAPFGCTMLRKHNVVIGVDGNLYRCDRQSGEKGKEIGTIQEGIDENSDIDKAFRCSVLDDKCMKCKYMPICGGDGGCRLDYLEQGKNCSVVEGVFRQNMQNHLTFLAFRPRY
ncbi:radical SAM/SPASM domain-containing protein [Butyrivibrio sp. AE3006]|uniref:radical SAM/SPASM domain-containing protein n=1 Tax=Butyrivibrio sp. AE3006 TaxID=1280673 RepID=UPI0003F9A4A9|nr:radical SAM protein [Butyrivibrio sp. AE3006]